ncbi:MAG TPA: bifunctional shikimate kinase/3-dehydroquinate synthase [Acidimicrobiales bacterium]|jgi:5-deoxy-5-amino-3-dehydroquinate synthase|nr:bifunctional shikimate kinase/3-dehydroquinate synthase [Acidimicrobiales bacterium]
MTSRRLGRQVVVVGPMGSGKTTIGTRLASAIGRPFRDSDAEIAHRERITTEQFMRSRGRDALHRLEREILLDVLDSDDLVVFAAAAGVVDDPACLAALDASAVTVVLEASRSTLLDRIGDGKGRPIDAPVDVTLEALERTRAPRFAAVADLTISTEHDEPSKAVAAIVDHLRRTVTVPLGARSYDVIVGPGATSEVATLLPTSAKRAAIVTQPGVGVTLDLPIPHETLEIPDGEASKSLVVLGGLASRFSQIGLTRDDVVIALGGGSVTDVAGFAAASYHRGTPVINVATTLLGQIDAAIGGKTGVNLPEGKNLLGAFWQPCGVICDTDSLETLPDRERRSGLGEMAKYAFLGVEHLDELSIVDQVAACVKTKADVVGADEREGSLRQTLNYGHTLAHALEAAGFADGEGRDGVDLRHGEAVAIGLIFAARLARLLGRIGSERVERHLEVVRRYGLPTEIPAAVDVDAAIAAMGRDKKATNGLTFVLDGPSGVEPVRDVPLEKIRTAFAETSAGASARS